VTTPAPSDEAAAKKKKKNKAKGEEAGCTVSILGSGPLSSSGAASIGLAEHPQASSPMSSEGSRAPTSAHW